MRPDQDQDQDQSRSRFQSGGIIIIPPYTPVFDSARCQTQGYRGNTNHAARPGPGPGPVTVLVLVRPHYYYSPYTPVLGSAAMHKQGRKT